MDRIILYSVIYSTKHKLLTLLLSYSLTLITNPLEVQADVFVVRASYSLTLITNYSYIGDYNLFLEYSCRVIFY
jgi:hypothetical protein